MFWIFANNIHNTFTSNNTTLGTTLANGWRNFHKINLLKLTAVQLTAKHLIILFYFQFVHTFYRSSAVITRQSG